MTGDREPDLDLLPDFDLADPAAEPDRLPDLDLADPAADREAADPDLRKIKMFSSSISYTDFRVRTMKIFEPDGNTTVMSLIFAIYFSDCFEQRGHPAIHKQSDIFRAQKHWE